MERLFTLRIFIALIFVISSLMGAILVSGPETFSPYFLTVGAEFVLLAIISVVIWFRYREWRFSLARWVLLSSTFAVAGVLFAFYGAHSTFSPFLYFVICATLAVSCSGAFLIGIEEICQALTADMIERVTTQAENLIEFSVPLGAMDPPSPATRGKAAVLFAVPAGFAAWTWAVLAWAPVSGLIPEQVAIILTGIFFLWVVLLIIAGLRWVLGLAGEAWFFLEWKKRRHFAPTSPSSQPSDSSLRQEKSAHQPFPGPKSVTEFG